MNENTRAKNTCQIKQLSPPNPSAYYLLMPKNLIIDQFIIHTFIYSLTLPPSIHLFILSIYSFIYLSIYLYIYLSIHLLMLPSIHQFIHLIILPSIPQFIHLLILPSIHQFIHLLILPSI